MCILCEDERAYQAYQAYLDKVVKDAERRAARNGHEAISGSPGAREGHYSDAELDAAMNAAIAAVTPQPQSNSTQSAAAAAGLWGAAPRQRQAANPLSPNSPFACDPVDE